MRNTGRQDNVYLCQSSRENRDRGETSDVLKPRHLQGRRRGMLRVDVLCTSRLGKPMSANAQHRILVSDGTNAGQACESINPIAAKHTWGGNICVHASAAKKICHRVRGRRPKLPERRLLLVRLLMVNLAPPNLIPTSTVPTICFFEICHTRFVQHRFAPV
jgi:hypothetical protein